MKLSVCHLAWHRVALHPLPVTKLRLASPSRLPGFSIEEVFSFEWVVDFSTMSGIGQKCLFWPFYLLWPKVWLISGSSCITIMGWNPQSISKLFSELFWAKVWDCMMSTAVLLQKSQSKEPFKRKVWHILTFPFLRMQSSNFPIQAIRNFPIPLQSLSTAGIYLGARHSLKKGRK